MDSENFHYKPMEDNDTPGAWPVWTRGARLAGTKLMHGHHFPIIKVKVGNDQEMARSERNSHSNNRGGKKVN